MSSSDELASALQHTVESMIRQETQEHLTSEQQGHEALRRDLLEHIDRAVKPYEELLKKAERLSQTSRSALSAAQTNEEGLAEVRSHLASIDNTVRGLSAQFAQMEERLTEFRSDYNRVARGSEAALSKASHVEQFVSGASGKSVSVAEKVAAQGDTLQQLQNEIVALRQDLSSVNNMVSGLRHNIVVKRSGRM